MRVFYFSVCACGKWICTGEKCPEKHQQKEAANIRSDSLGEEEEIEEEEDEEEEDDDEIDSEEYDEEEQPEDDPDVQDINWF